MSSRRGTRRAPDDNADTDGDTTVTRTAVGGANEPSAWRKTDDSDSSSNVQRRSQMAKSVTERWDDALQRLNKRRANSQSGQKKASFFGPAQMEERRRAQEPEPLQIKPSKSGITWGVGFVGCDGKGRVEPERAVAGRLGTADWPGAGGVADDAADLAGGPAGDDGHHTTTGVAVPWQRVAVERGLKGETLSSDISQQQQQDSIAEQVYAYMT